MLSSHPRRFVPASGLFALAALATTRVQAQGLTPKEILAKEAYQRPPAVVDRIVSANRGAAISFTNPSPDRKWFMRVETEGLGSLETFGKGHIYLGGLQVDTAAFRVRSITTRGGHAITLIDPTTGKSRTIETPKSAGVTNATWSPDGKTIAYMANFDTASHIVLVDVATGKQTTLTKARLNAVHVGTFSWTADGTRIVTVLVPEPFKAAPPAPKVALSPMVRLTEGAVDKERIHPSLLFDQHDKDLLEYYSTGQLAVIDVKTRLVTRIGAPAMIRGVDASPDGKLFRVTMVMKPFSYIVPFSSFGQQEQLWDVTGKSLLQIRTQAMRQVADTAANDSTAAPATDPDLNGKTIVGWNPLGAGLLVVERPVTPRDTSAAAAGGRGAGGRGAGGGRAAGAGGGGGGRNGGGGGGGAPQGPSKLEQWVAPFGATDTRVIYASSGTLSNPTFSPDLKTLFVTASGQTYAMRMADTTKHIPLLGAQLAAAGGRGGRGGGGGGGGGRGGGNGANGNVGTIVTKSGTNGISFVQLGTDNKTIFLSGNRTPGAAWETSGPRSWVDKMDIETGTRTRFFDAPDKEFDNVVAALDDDYSKYVVTRESPTMIQDSYLYDMKGAAPVKLTNNVDFAPEVTQAIRKRLWATRPDGVKFEVDVTLPRDYKEGTKLPGIIWFYPTEVATQQAYDNGRQGTNINRFPSVGARSAEIWVTQGYVVIQPQAIPVFGGSTVNDHYIEELRDGLASTIETVVNAGYLDRNRVGLWGHSYGAFSTVNAMVNTKWFKAGIAGDGMYNRSLTPYGFQNERRDFWAAQDTYLKMSPFFKAPDLSGALLMYHQIEDQNEGTDPISSIRMFHALLGQGKQAALFMYPYEDHGPATKETDLDQWARFIAWFDIYVKNPSKTIVP